MATTSETGIKHKTLPIQEKLEIINKVGYYFRLLLDKEGIALDCGVSVSHGNTELLEVETLVGLSVLKERLCGGSFGMCGKIPAEWLSSA